MTLSTLQRRARRAASQRAWRQRKKLSDPGFLKRESARVAQYKQRQNRQKKKNCPECRKRQIIQDNEAGLTITLRINRD